LIQSIADNLVSCRRRARRRKKIVCSVRGDALSRDECSCERMTMAVVRNQQQSPFSDICSLTSCTKRVCYCVTKCRMALQNCWEKRESVEHLKGPWSAVGARHRCCSLLKLQVASESTSRTVRVEARAGGLRLYCGMYNGRRGGAAMVGENLRIARMLPRGCCHCLGKICTTLINTRPLSRCFFVAFHC
jgi:hypothetical protein